MLVCHKWRKTIFGLERFIASYRYLINVGFIYWRHINLQSQIANQLRVGVTILLSFFTLLIIYLFIYLFMYLFYLLIFLQFFDHPVIIDLLTDWWCGGYKNRKLSRLWWLLLTVWCLLDIVLFPLIFLLTCVMGKVIYLHEFVDISFSLRANSLGRYGGGAGKGRRACNYVSGIWISASKKSTRNAYWQRWISNEVISPGTSFSMFVYIHARFRFALNGGNLTARSDGELQGNWRWNSNSGEIVAISPFFSRPAARSSWRACLQATSL